jgi:very-short-patch-repair endonuclease
MVLRTARSGGRTGSKFYGCTNFPKCRGTRSVVGNNAGSRKSPTAKKPDTSRTPKAQQISESISSVTPPQPVDPVLRQKIEVAVKGWVESLVDFTRNNNLLFYRDTKTTTLDLSEADPDILAQLLDGESVSFQDLFRRLDLLGPDGEVLKKDIWNRIKKIRGKAQENYEERSIGTLSLARGFATWDMPQLSTEGRAPNAPIFIYGLEVRPGKRRDDLTIVASGEPEINPVLQLFLKREFGIDINVSETDEGEGDAESIERILNVFREQWAELSNLSINDKLAISNFSYAKLSMVQDLETGIDDLSNHHLVLALAGDQDALDKVRNQVTDIDLGLPNRVEPVNEFLILDADSSQNEVINAMVAGQSFAFEGPPGTGKSQTIANSIACLVAEGKKVLFVAEKRAAIDAVIRRLSSVGLEDMIMDFHGAGKKRRDVLDELGRAHSVVGGISVNVPDESFPVLVEARQTLLRHNEELFRVHEPWGISLYDVLEIGSAVPEGVNLKFRFRLDDLEKLTPERLRLIAGSLSQFEGLGGFVDSIGARVWRTAAFKTTDEITRAIGALKDLNAGSIDRYDRAVNQARDVLTTSTLDRDKMSEIAELASDIDRLQRKHGEDVFDINSGELLKILKTRTSKIAVKIATIFSRSFRNAVVEARSFFGESLLLKEICESLSVIQRISKNWNELVPDSKSVPVVMRSSLIQELVNSKRHLNSLKTDLLPFSNLVMAIDTNKDLAASLASDLLRDETVGRGVLECSGLRQLFDDYGMEPLIAEIQSLSLSSADLEAALTFVWSQSLSEHMRATSPVLATTTVGALDRAVETFCNNDIRHISSKPEQIKRIWARDFADSQTRYPKQEQSLLASINRKRKLPGLSKVFADAPDVISALKPCWVMSPLSVSMLRPPSGWFDVVIFDEASQIPPADAITSIKAAKQMVVAGDSLQLPPTPFFAAGEIETDDPYEDESDEEVSNSSDYESILDFVKIIVPKYRQLRWHYRSRDERLIAFSNFKLYKSLIAFPYAGADTTLQHLIVPNSEKARGNGASNPAEVDVVRDLVIKHAMERPNESLGVIALGIRHSTAIEDALNNARLSNTVLDSFLSSDLNGEPFFVKNLERVQGDERDCIILSIGYGRGTTGQIRYTFGPILGAKGERRLNVATTRAKLRMTSVATFGAGDLDISKTSRGGAAFLREYLAFVESGGNDLPDKGSTRVQMNPFEQSVYDQLSKRGVMLIPQYGVGNYRLDFAVQNPEKPGEFLLAIECDGRSYHSYPTARERDRLREAALRQRGWKFHRIWSDHWFAHPEQELERAITAIAGALISSKNTP